jgi:surface protein
MLGGVNFKGLFMRGAWSGSGYANDSASRLSLVNLKNWGDCEIVNLLQAFYQCNNMVYSASDKPNLNSFSALGNVRQTFSYCYSITSLDLSNWTDTDKFKRHDAMLQMDSTSSLLEYVNLTGWDFSNSTTLAVMCYGIGNATTDGCEVIMPNVVSSVTSLTQFWGDAYLKSLTVPNWNIGAGAAVNCYRMIWSAVFAPVQEVDFSTWTIKPSTMQDWARGCIGVSKFDLSGWDTSACTRFDLAFYFSTSLEEVAGLENFDGSAATTIRGMFALARLVHFSNYDFGSDWGPNLGNCILSSG